MRERRDSLLGGAPEPGLARFAGAILDDPAVFGGGADRATATRRRDTVAYGYLGVVEEYARPGSGERWRLLTVTMPGGVPRLVVDHRSALHRPGVPAAGATAVAFDDAGFDEFYLVTADDPVAARRILTPAVRRLLVGTPIQRLELERTMLALRSFDFPAPAADADDRLAGLAEAILRTAPCFVASGAWVGLPGAVVTAEDLPAGDTPLLPGRYGRLDTEPTDEELGHARSRRLNAALVALAALVVAVAAVLVLVLV
jgi:hypothetical protein